MITNFEDQTYELTQSELKIVPLIITGFKNYRKDNPIKEPEIVKRFNNKNFEVKLNGVRLRKIVNYIRSNSLLPLIATSKGYYVSYDKDVIASQIHSLRQRSYSINKCADGLADFLKHA